MTRDEWIVEKRKLLAAEGYTEIYVEQLGYHLHTQYRMECGTLVSYATEDRGFVIGLTINGKRAL